MKLELDAEFLRWLSEWDGEFEWDKGNCDKNEKHGLNRVEIESIFESSVYVAGKIMDIEESRWLLLGETGSKGWALIVTSRDEKLRVISCRRQRKKEAIFYEGFKKEIQN
ncbi:MAG: BrnT family toxin [Deltaproteobacteria bacterium]|nr:BrnT family toxin [Deltaproteobacteria bacterium]